MARPLQDPEIRKKEILDTAEMLFYANGYQQTMISDITKKISVAKGTFYYYFSSKEELVESLIYRHLAPFNSGLEELVSSPNISPPQKIDLIAPIIYNTVQHKEGLLLEYLYTDQYLHLIDKLFRQARKILSPFLLRIIEEGREKNIFRVDNAATAVNCILALAQCLVEAMYSKASSQTLSAHLMLVKDLIEKAVKLPEGTLQMNWEEIKGQFSRSYSG